MILRKPYAFFIKHFKLIHFVLALLVFYSTYRTKILLDFFNEYIGQIVNVTGQDLVGTFFNSAMFVVPILAIIFTITVMVVMLVKKKPIVFYITNIIIFIFLIIVLAVTRSTLEKMELAVLDIRTIRLIRDLLSAGFIAQLFSSIIVSVRATGFNIKKFDFNQDLQKLQIDEADREEFEVDISVDRNKTKRFFKRQIRKWGYAYKENKIVIIIGIVMIIAAIGVGGVLYVNSRPKYINQGTIFSGNGFSASVVGSYLTKKDYLGKTISDEYSYLIVQLKIKNNSKEKKVLEPATTKILIGNYVYTPIFTEREVLFDFGNLYSNEEIPNSSEFLYKNLVYRIPTPLVNNKITFSFVDKNSALGNKDFKSALVDIKYINLDENIKQNMATLTDKISFENTQIGDYRLTINSFDIQPSFKISYNYCYSGECIKSYEYIKPSIMSNYNKVLLKLEGNLEINSAYRLTNVLDLYDFIYRFGTLKYEIDGKTITHPVSFKRVISNKTKHPNTYYVEVLEEVSRASKISIVFKVRNQIYEYVLK